MPRRPGMLSRPDVDAAAPAATRALTVSELNRGVRALLERGYPLLNVRGEISGFTRAASGHLYFSLKDAGAQVRCAMWRKRATGLDWSPRDGDAVEVRASVTLFETRGEYQLNVESVRRAGAGALFEAFLRLKEKLERAGLFDAARKRALPAFPRAIGVVTSPNAAALRDVLTTLRRRAPMIPVIIYPTPVQGEGAGAQVAAAIAAAGSRGEVDVLIVCRGGGSIEDLWAFNEESVARAIAACPMPVISGVGHETDFTIADFAADLRAPTPTAAAELAAPAHAALLADLIVARRALARAFEARLGEARQRLDWLARALLSPAERLQLKRRDLEQLGQRLASAGRRVHDRDRARLDVARHRLRQPELGRMGEQVDALSRDLARAAREAVLQAGQRLHRHRDALEHLNPAGVLARGYGIVRGADGRIVRDAGSLAAGDALDVTLARGGARVRVEKPYST